MTIQARLETFEATSRRSSPRRKLSLLSTLPSSGLAVLIHDLSSTGVLLQTEAKLEPFDDIEIDLPEIGATNAFVVWNSGEYFGCEFAAPISKAAISAALLRNPISPSVATAQPISRPTAPDAEFEQDQLHFGAKLRVVLGVSAALWAVILWAVGII